MTNSISSYVRVIALFHDDITQRMTIRQIGLAAHGSYGWAYEVCHELIRLNVLRAERIGNSICCRANADSDMTILLLALVSAQKTRSLLQADESFARRVRDILRVLSGPQLCVVHTPKGFGVVTTSEPPPQPPLVPEPLFAIPPNEMCTVLPQATVLQNFELAWRLALKAPRKDDHGLQ